MPDPWAEFHLEDIETEHATRYRSVRLCALSAVLKQNLMFSARAVFVCYRICVIRWLKTFQ